MPDRCAFNVSETDCSEPSIDADARPVVEANHSTFDAGSRPFRVVVATIIEFAEDKGRAHALPKTCARTY
jgi:hypothetical protein